MNTIPRCAASFRILHAMTLILLLCSTAQAAPAASDQSAVKVLLKDAPSPGAKVVEEIRLYAESHALVIGIDDYRNGWPRLSNAVASAEKVAQGLKSSGFEVTVKKNPSCSQLKSAFEDFFIAKGANPEARLFVWFSGHGHTIDGNGFLVPADAAAAEHVQRFKLTALSLQRFSIYVRMAKAKHIFTVFDASVDGTIFDMRRSIPPAAITRMTTFPVRQFLTSGDSGQTLSDDSRFADFFLKVLSGEEDADFNHDGYLTGTELSLFIVDRISYFAKDRRPPRFGKLRNENFDRGDFVFVLQKKSVPKPDADASPADGQNTAPQSTTAPPPKGSRPLPPLSF